MISLFSRLAFIIVVAILLTLLVTRTFLERPVAVTALELLSGHAQLSAERIATTPPVERRSRTEALAKRLGYPVRLEAATGSAEPRSETRSGRVFVVVRVPDNPGQMVFGPLPLGHVTGLSTIFLLAVIVASLFSLLLCVTAIRRIRSLEDVAARMCKGDFAARAERDENDALDGIGASLNQLADRVGQLLTDERDLLRTVAHEVRTPISRMRFRVESIERKATEETRKSAAGLVSDLEQVDRLFEELLTYVAFEEFDQDRPDMQTAIIPLVDAVSRVVEEVTATRDDIAVEIVGDQTAKVVANQKLFDRAVTNLLLNAMAYGGPNLHVDIRAFDDECAVDVQDSGPGIPELDRPKVIKPFVRLAQKKTKGTGLGLAIVSRIMRLHGGQLHIVDAPRGGASVQLVWKNAEPRTRSRRRPGVLTSRPRA